MSYQLTTVFKTFERKARRLSLELCPSRKLNIEKVKNMSAPFCSVTWLDNKVCNIAEHPTIELSRELIKTNINVLIHLPGRIYSKQEMFEILTTIKTIGVKNILAMQGETSLGESKEDFPYAYNLVKYIRETFSDYFCIGVTGYPSGHPRSPNLNEDLAHLKQKIDSGAQFIITQAVFDIDTYRSFYTRCSAVGINVPIVPGLFVINSYSSLIKMARLCKLHLPDDLMKFMQDNKDNADVIEEYGISSFTNIVEQLFNSDDLPIYCVHIFTLNNFDILEKALSRLNL